MISEWVRERNGPVILMGDFNDSPGSALHVLLTKPDTGLRDAWQLLEREEDATSFTRHRFDGLPQKTRMDWILFTSQFHILDAYIIRDHWGTSYPSDHFPVMAEVEL